MLRTLKDYVSNALHLSLGLCFLILSILFALWVTRIPEIKGTLQLSEGDLGTALFFTPLGALISMIVSTKLIRRFGAGKSSIIALTYYCGAMCLPFLAQTYILLCAALFVTGLAMGWVDISINAAANTIEKRYKVKIMNTSHGFWSLGGIVGGVIGGITASLLIDGFFQMAITSSICTLILWLFIHQQLVKIRDDDESEGKKFALPGKGLLWLALVAFCILLSEGAVVDWSTVFLKDTLGSTAATAGFGYALFSATMTLGRFNGDYLIQRFGAKQIMMLGLLIAISGFVLLLFSSIPMALTGFAIIGIGYSSVVPIIFAEAARKNSHSPTAGLAAVATLGYTGFLTGPVIMGWIAEWQNLTFSFGMLLLITCIALITFRQDQ